MAMFRGCSVLVIRCFKRVESLADWVTGAAGPWFVGLCWILIVTGGIAFFDVIARELSWSTTVLMLPILVLVPINLYGQYFLVCQVPPGHPSNRALAKSPRPMSTERETRWLSLSAGSRWSPEGWGRRRAEGNSTRPLMGSDDASFRGEVFRTEQDTTGRTKRVRRCRKCDGPKPERTHHCSVCKRCVLLMDHHCPWINGCVGIHNQRYFVLFMVWLSIACWTVCALGYGALFRSFDYNAEWIAFTPRIGYTLLFVLSVAIGVAVPVLCSWHIFMVMKGETSIESHDNAYLEGRAKSEGLIFLNPYDLGRRRNLELFFNVGQGGYSYLTLLLPLVVPAYTNGWTFPRRPLPSAVPHPKIKLHAPELADGLVRPVGAQSQSIDRTSVEGGEAGEEFRSRYVVGGDEELTDDEEGGGGWMEWEAGT